MELGRLLGGLHPLFVHFPIVLILLGVACDALAWMRRNERLSWAGLWLTLLGTASLLVAFVCGILAECFAARAGMPQEPMEAHERFATATTWLFIALASVRLFLGATPIRRSLATYLLFALVGCGLLMVTGHRGTHVTYEYGANVAGALSLHGPSDEDLATIAQHQEQLTLTYSNRMHHIFGWLVLALGVVVLCERVQLGAVARLRALMPVLFLGGGMYLFIFSDWDSWPLSTLRPVTDAEVMLHKAIAVMMMAGGVAAFWKRRRPTETASRVDGTWAWQNRLIAVMAMAGGGALFTHIHTNAPYTANAVGVYLNHAAMGLVALAIAGAVLWEDARPRSRLVALLLPVLLLAQSLLLIRYNEDLPWFLGYHEIDATPPRGGVLAQTPGGRAELVFHPTNGMLSVQFYPSWTNQVLTPPAQVLDGELLARSARTWIRFTGASNELTSAAPWLRAEPVFTLRLDMPAGPGRNQRKIAEFDPVVTAPILPPLIGAEKVYGCPMCVDTLSSKPGQCPMCGMELETIPLASVRPASFWENTLTRPQPVDDGRYRIDLRTEPGPPHAGTPVELKFAFHESKNDTVVKEFHTIHTKLMHLLIVSKDLSWFDHVHPELQPDGQFLLSQVFPFGGDFLLFADVTPVGSRTRIFRVPVRVEGTARPVAPLVEDDGAARVFEGHQVSLRLTPTPALGRGHVQLAFTIRENGKPVDDLDLFLGASGHCVILHEDTETFIHTHPVQLTAMAPPPAGPEVVFHAYLPKRGLYKVWGQFNHRGTIITADFVFRAR